MSKYQNSGLHKLLRWLHALHSDQKEIEPSKKLTEDAQAPNPFSRKLLQWKYCKQSEITQLKLKHIKDRRMYSKNQLSVSD